MVGCYHSIDKQGGKGICVPLRPVLGLTRPVQAALRHPWAVDDTCTCHAAKSGVEMAIPPSLPPSSCSPPPYAGQSIRTSH